MVAVFERAEGVAGAVDQDPFHGVRDGSARPEALPREACGERPTKSVLDDRATGGVTEIREVWRGCAAFAGREGDQADVGAKAEAQPVGVSSSIREAGCVATRSRTSLKYRKGSTPASLQPCVRV